MNIPKPKSYSKTIEDLHSQVYVLENDNRALTKEVVRLNKVNEGLKTNLENVSKALAAAVKVLPKNNYWDRVPVIKKLEYGDIEPGMDGIS